MQTIKLHLVYFFKVGKTQSCCTRPLEERVHVTCEKYLELQVDLYWYNSDSVLEKSQLSCLTEASIHVRVLFV